MLTEYGRNWRFGRRCSGLVAGCEFFEQFLQFGDPRFSSSGRLRLATWLRSAAVYSKAGEPVTAVLGVLMDLLYAALGIYFGAIGDLEMTNNTHPSADHKRSCPPWCFR